MSEFRPSRSVMRWVVFGLVLSSTVVIIISVISGVTISQLAAIGYLPFVLASGVSATRLLVQITRFHVVVKGLAGEIKVSLKELATASMGSEFVALSTPSMSGGEIVRAAWLRGKGVDGGKALWMGYFEVLIDVYVCSALAIAAAVYAFSRGAFLIASIITAVVLFLLTAYTFFFLFPARKGIRIPKRIFSLATRLVGARRGRKFKKAVVGGADDFSAAASEILRKGSLLLVSKVLILGIVQALLSGLSLWIVLTSAGLRIDLLSTTVAICAITIIAAVPVSIGGSGIAELGVQYYLFSIYQFNSWAAVIMWRIASYQVVLAICGMAFLFFVHRVTKGASA